MKSPSAAVTLTLSGCSSLGQLADALSEMVAPLGMNAVSSAMVSGPLAGSAWPYHFTRWPAHFLLLYQSQDLAARDPMLRWGLASGEAITWAGLKTAAPGDFDPVVEDARRACGLVDGLVVPVRLRDGLLGVVSVGGPARGPFSEAERVYLIGLANVALHRAEALGGAAATASAAASRLSLREIECVDLLRQGMTDKQIAKVLGIAAETARFHITNARRKVGARNRAHLAALPLGAYS